VKSVNSEKSEYYYVRHFPCSAIKTREVYADCWQISMSSRDFLAKKSKKTAYI